MLGFMEKICYFILYNQYIVFSLYIETWLVFQHVHCLADFKQSASDKGLLLTPANCDI